MLTPIIHPNLSVVISEREDGNQAESLETQPSATVNRMRLYKKTKLDPNQITVMRVMHGNEYQQVSKVLSTSPLAVDALITDRPGTTLGLLTADCIPLIFFCPETQSLALVHLGWKNNDIYFAQTIVKALHQTYQVDPKNLVAYLGPAILGTSYRYQTDSVRERFDQKWLPYLTDQVDGFTRVDNVSFCFDQLLRSGLLEENINLSGIDTGSDQRFYSHHQSTHHHEPAGRFITLATISRSD